MIHDAVNPVEALGCQSMRRRYGVLKDSNFVPDVDVSDALAKGMSNSSAIFKARSPHIDSVSKFASLVRALAFLKA